MAEKRSKIYFASDFHLGAPNQQESLARERKIVQWLKEIQTDAAALYLLGDLFDFWYEYKHAVPKGYIRLLGQLAEMADSGVAIHIFAGNHDLWLHDYLPGQITCQIHHGPVVHRLFGRQFYLAHGDGLGPGDKGYKFLRKIFVNPASQWLFRQLHPDVGIGLANYFSRKSRQGTGTSDNIYYGEEKEWLIIHTRAILQEGIADICVYGHRHLPKLLSWSGEGVYLNLGDWIQYNSYAEWDGTTLKLCYFENSRQAEAVNPGEIKSKND